MWPNTKLQFGENGVTWLRGEMVASMRAGRRRVEPASGSTIIHTDRNSIDCHSIIVFCLAATSASVL